MAVDTSTFQIRIPTTADLSGVDAAKKSLKELAQESIAAGNVTKISSEESAAATEKHAGSLKHAGHEAHEAGLSHHTLHQAIHLLKEGAGEALGPIGELAHFLGNPYVMATAGAVLAIKMLIEQHQKLKEQQIEQLKASQELREMFESNLRNAIYHVTEQLADYHRELAHATEIANPFAVRLQQLTNEFHAQAEAVNSLAAAQLALNEARIHGLEIEGRVSGPEANREQTEARRQAREEEEEARRVQQQRDIEAQRQAAAEATAASEAAQRQHDDPARTQRRVGLGAAVEDARHLAEERHRTVTEAEERQREAQANTDLSRTHEIVQAREALERARAQERAQQETLSRATIQQSDFEAETTRLAQRSIELRRFAEDTTRAADAQERLNRSQHTTEVRTDAVHDETENQNRRNPLLERINSGHATDADRAEYAGATAAVPAAMLADVTRALRELEQAISLQGGRATEDQQTRLQRLHEQLIGVRENERAEHQPTSANLADSRIGRDLARSAVNEGNQFIENMRTRIAGEGGHASADDVREMVRVQHRLMDLIQQFHTTGPLADELRQINGRLGNLESTQLTRTGATPW